jgi:hypothetical protein
LKPLLEHDNQNEFNGCGLRFNSNKAFTQESVIMATTNPMRFTQFHRFVGAAVSRDAFAVAANSRSYKVVLHQRQVLLMSPKLLTYE